MRHPFQSAPSFGHAPAIARCRRRVVASLVVACVLLVGNHRAFSETWAEKLGFPAGKRVVILHAEKAGMCDEVNGITQRMLEDGSVQSASAMVPGPWFAVFAEWQRQHPKHDIGLSLTLHHQWKNYPWRPVAPRTEVPGIVDADGFLCRNAQQFIFNAQPEEVEREILAQLQFAFKNGFRPTHLRSHQGLLFSRIDLARAYLDIARKHWIPAVVIELTEDHVERFRAEGFPLGDDLIDLIAEYPLPKIDDLQFVPDADSYQQKVEAFKELVRGLSPGITQIISQPAEESVGLRKIDDKWQQFVWDGKLLGDPEVQQFLKVEGIVFTNWKEMMQRFEGDVSRKPEEGDRDDPFEFNPQDDEPK